MLIEAFPAGPLAANCYVIGDAAGGPCVVVDPGQRAADRLAATVAARGWRPAAVLATHGHFDHVADAAVVCAAHDVALRIGAGDVSLLADPLSGLTPDFRAVLPGLLMAGESLGDLRPHRVDPLAGGERLHLPGVAVDVLATPGHTPGAVCYRIAGTHGEPDTVLTGDTLFAGTIGRTDLPGGSLPQLLRSIADRLLRLPDDTVVLPGHGPATTIGAERAANPYLAR